MLTLRRTFGRAEIAGAIQRRSTSGCAGGRAGEGNRTLVSSLGSWRSTIELHPRRGRGISILDFRLPICKRQTHCQEMTSSEPEYLLLPSLPSFVSFPSDHAITPCRMGSGPAPLFGPYGFGVI